MADTGVRSSLLSFNVYGFRGVLCSYVLVSNTISISHDVRIV
jgi:hypothetical protein